MLMTHDEVWLAMIEALYGKEYVEKLLKKQNEDKEEFDVNRQSENGEWGYQKIGSYSPPLSFHTTNILYDLMN